MIGEQVHWFDVIDSTNDYVLKNYEYLHDGDIVVALEQTKGKGRKGRIWHSPRGGLWFSVVFKPRNAVDLNFYTKLASVSLANVLKKFDISPIIKWPNDIVIDGKKLAGILTEGIFEGRKPKVIVVGIGINVNNDLPQELKNYATSLKELLKKEIPVQSLLDLLIRELRSNYKKYYRHRGALTRIWKELLDLKEEQKISVNGKDCIILKILQEGLVVYCQDEIITLLDLDRQPL